MHAPVKIYSHTDEKPGKGWKALAAGAAMAAACAGLYYNHNASLSIAPQAASSSPPADQCLRDGYRGKLKPMFGKVSQSGVDAAWDNISFDCVQMSGLPQDVSIAIDTSKTGQARYIRELSPDGF